MRVASRQRRGGSPSPVPEGPGEPTDTITARFAPLHPRVIDLSLGRIQRLLADLGAPQERLPPVVHVAGTNGKGSTVAFMRAILEAAGKSVHVYTSPHLVRFNERIRLAGELVDDERLLAALDVCERVNAGAADLGVRDHHRRGLAAVQRDAGRLSAARSRAWAAATTRPT